jgi:hypothetical protein
LGAFAAWGRGRAMLGLGVMTSGSAGLAAGVRLMGQMGHWGSVDTAVSDPHRLRASLQRSTANNLDSTAPFRAMDPAVELQSLFDGGFGERRHFGIGLGWVGLR